MNKNTMYQLTQLSESHAREILNWRYSPPYHFYDPPLNGPEEKYIAAFTDEQYQFHAVLDWQGKFVGFSSFGIDGQVSGGNYDEEALDIGLGMKPELTGKGLGEQFFSAILQYAVATFSPEIIRLTVAKFNSRALHLYNKFGFSHCSDFYDSRTGTDYTILTLSPVNIPCDFI